MNSPTGPVNRIRLAEADRAAYHETGYFIPRAPLFPAHKFERLRETFEQILAELDSGVRPESMDVPHFQYPQLFEWLFAGEVLDLIEPITGPDIALFSSHFICKPGGSGKRVPWHEDSHYWKTMLAPMEVVTVWLAIDPSTRENGCMWVIPGTHRTGKQGFSDYDDLPADSAVFPDEITPGQRDEKRAVPVELEAGQCSLHDARLMHGSPPNLSPIRRCGYTMRYMSTRVRFQHETCGSWQNIYLARGRDHAGNVYGDPARAYPEKARFRTAHGKRGH